MFDISAYRLTIIAAIVVLILSAALLTALSGVANTAGYLAFLGPTVVALLAVLRGEQNAKQANVQHAENSAALSKLVSDNNALAEALHSIKSSDMTVEQAAKAAADVMQLTPVEPSIGGTRT